MCVIITTKIIICNWTTTKMNTSIYNKNEKHDYNIKNEKLSIVLKFKKKLKKKLELFSN
jgi:hypothetical protein